MLLKLLNTRYDLAKNNTKKFHDEIKESISDYEAKGQLKKNGVHDKHVKEKRYDIIIPYIFAAHESMMASLFEKMPEILITGRTGGAEDKVAILKALYSYLEDKCDLDEFLNISAWWFFLVGMAIGNTDYKIEVDKQVPQLDNMGQPMLDENGEPLLMPTYSYHDPVATVENPLKVYFAPDSEFSIDGSKIPYYVKERLVEVDEIEEVYGKVVDPDEEVEIDGSDLKADEKSDLQRAKVKYYYGSLPKHCKDELEELKDPDGNSLEWAFGKEYQIYYTATEILFAKEIEEKQCKLARFYAPPSSFFGYGIAKTLRPFQNDMSVRRSQQLRYADMFAFPWLAVPNGLKIDQAALQDYKKTKPLVYTGEKDPYYLTPPQMPSVIAEADQASRSDAQFVSGTLDISKGAQQTNTVKTATGQQLFAQSQDKRLQKARKALAKYYREIVISLFKQCRDNWEEHKTISYTNDEGDTEEMDIQIADLQDIDFDTDIDFNLDSVSVNQDIMSQRWISLLEQSANLPFANQEKIFQKVLRESYKINNPETYVKSPEEMQPPQEGQPMEQPAEEMPQEMPMLGDQMAPQVETPYAGPMGT